MAGQASFDLLEPRIQRFVWEQGWDELRDVQNQVIPLVLQADQDILVAAATASGKTEAVFFPALTHLLREEPVERLIVYISPLKALINDQFSRLGLLCERLEIPVWRWHGDVSASSKTRFRRAPHGVLLITPESLEAMLCLRGNSIHELFGSTAFLIVDELHAFMGTERGKQLQSLMHRIELAIGRPVPRIGLSATLGDMSLAQDFLRPRHATSVHLVNSIKDHALLKVELRGYLEPAVPPAALLADDDGVIDDSRVEETSPASVAQHLYSTLRGSNNLVFPNSRNKVEEYTYRLNSLCEAHHVPQEFWPHHGSLSRDIREETESALKAGDRPATAVCTNTLELGIDIGSVKSIAQIGPAPSVASLRQRLGRSGRRKGEPAILRFYAIEDEITSDSRIDVRLRLGLVQTVAMVLLLVERWFEPPKVGGAHLSTLVQQLLSIVSQANGISPQDVFERLCTHDGSFSEVSSSEFAELLKQLGSKQVLMQESSGLLLLGTVGERIVNHYTFFAAFKSEDEFRIVTAGRAIGSMPISQLLLVGQRIVFAGRMWFVDDVDDAGKTVYVVPSPGGAPPTFGGDSGPVHRTVRAKMRGVLEGTQAIGFLDDMANRLLEEARRNYRSLSLATRNILTEGDETLVVTWLGTPANEALACWLRRRGLEADPSPLGVTVRSSNQSQLQEILRDSAIDDVPPVAWLLDGAKNLERQKWDSLLPTSLLQKTYASLNLDMMGALVWLQGSFGNQPERLEAGSS